VKYSGAEHILLKEVERSMAGRTIISQGSNFYLLAVFFWLCWSKLVVEGEIIDSRVDFLVGDRYYFSKTDFILLLGHNLS
jgi:hypothetical protein